MRKRVCFLSFAALLAVTLSGCRGIGGTVEGLIDKFRDKVPAVPEAGTSGSPRPPSNQPPQNIQYTGFAGGTAETLTSPSFRVNQVVIGSKAKRAMQ